MHSLPFALCVGIFVHAQKCALSSTHECTRQKDARHPQSALHQRQPHAERAGPTPDTSGAHAGYSLPGPPTQYYLGYAYARSLPLKAPPYLRTDNISEPPFRGLFAGFSCLGDPPKSKTLLNLPPIFYFITPFLNFSGVQRERERKTTPFLKKSPGEKSNTPLFFFFYNSRAGLCRTKSTPLPEILGTRMRSLRPRSGGGGGGPGFIVWGVANT